MATLTAVQFEIAALDLVPVNVVEDESEGGVTETVKVEEESLRIKMLPVVVNTWPFVNATRKGWFVVIVFFFSVPVHLSLFLTPVVSILQLGVFCLIKARPWMRLNGGAGCARTSSVTALWVTEAALMRTGRPPWMP